MTDAGHTPLDTSMLDRLQDRLEDDCPHDPVCETATGGYRYRDADMKVIHYTSAPLNNEEALTHFHDMGAWGATWKPRYVERRPRILDTYYMLPFQFVDGEVVPLS